MIGCFGGGSNFAGIALPYLPDKLNGSKVRLLAVEPAACPTLTKGAFEYDFGDVAGMTPLMKMYTLGHKFVPPKIHAGGLRYHGASPLCSHLLKHGWLEARAYPQLDVFQAALQFAQTEGIIPAPESVARHQGRHRRGAGRRRRKARSGSCCSTSAATAISICPPMRASSAASLRTSVSRPN